MIAVEVGGGVGDEEEEGGSVAVAEEEAGSVAAELDEGAVTASFLLLEAMMMGVSCCRFTEISEFVAECI